MKKVIKLATWTIALLFLLNCSAPPIEIEQNGGEITKVETKYSTALKNVNSIISVFYGEPINIYVEKITDNTTSGGKLHRDISTTVQASFNSIGSNIRTLPRLNILIRVVCIVGTDIPLWVSIKKNNGIPQRIKNHNI